MPPDQNASEWLDHIADMLGAEASCKLTVYPDGHHNLVAKGHDDHAISQYRERYHRLDPLPRLLDERPAGRAIVLDTTRHPAYQASPELCNNYLRPHGIDHIIATQWREPDGTRHIVGIQRFRGSEPFSIYQGQELDRYVHHWRIGNALPLSQGLTTRPPNSRRTCDIAEQLNIPLAVVNANLVVAWANTAAHEHTGSAWRALFEKLAGNTPDGKYGPRLRELVGACLRQHSPKEALINASDDTWFVTATPVTGKPNLTLLRQTALHHGNSGILRHRLEHLYGLTHAEAELTAHLVQGESLDNIASVRRVTLETVRGQLRTIFKKTGTHRQGELVCLAGALVNR
ncbi:MAG: helix-turn-helix transcriptional regulator [Dechloromonas sp.]|nr:helix-turn-helix transcriptional regulator [Dechloromonas sp.]